MPSHITTVTVVTKGQIQKVSLSLSHRLPSNREMYFKTFKFSELYFAKNQKKNHAHRKNFS